jgi:nicotinate-nucleotide pyrophosphorylase (carboxylating)
VVQLLEEEMLNPIHLRRIVESALMEDIGSGDLTTNLIAQGEEIVAEILAKDNGILAGIGVAEQTFKIIQEGIRFDAIKRDGSPIRMEQLVARVQGCAIGILTGERVALNFLQRMSGVATATSRFVKVAKPYGVKILDTRKTIPGLRALDKYAVRIGGGYNHRFELSSGVLIKENHIKVAGGIRRAVERVKKGAPHTLKIEVETQSLEEVKEALGAGVDIIMLDNMKLEEMEEAVRIIKSSGGGPLIEVSGKLDELEIERIVQLEINFISIGAITHSARAIDFSLEVV